MLLLAAACLVQPMPAAAADDLKPLLTFKGHAERVWTVIYSPDGKQIASGANGHMLKVWDAGTGKELQSLSWGGKGGGAVLKLAYSPDGKRIAAANNHDEVQVWDTLNGKQVHAFKGWQPKSMAFTPDGKQIIGVSDSIWVFDVKAGRSTPRDCHFLSPAHVVLSPDCTQYCASTHASSAVKLVETGQERFPLKEAHTCAAYSGDGKRIATSGAGGVRVWDAETGLQKLCIRGASASHLAFTPDGKRIVCAFPSWIDRGKPIPGMIQVWDAKSGKRLQTLTHLDLVGPFAFSPDCKQLVAGDDAKALKVWGLPTE